MNSKIYGYKLFNDDWKCLDKQYICPGHFTEYYSELKPCQQGMHFCITPSSCFDYFMFKSIGHLCMVEAYGDIEKDSLRSIYCTNNLKIMKEISMQDFLDKVHYNGSISNNDITYIKQLDKNVLNNFCWSLEYAMKKAYGDEFSLQFQMKPKSNYFLFSYHYKLLGKWMHGWLSSYKLSKIVCDLQCFNEITVVNKYFPDMCKSFISGCSKLL